MKIRMLRLEDAPLMLEWMHDRDVVDYLQANFTSKTLEDCKEFIISSLSDKKNLHYAIVDENDNYMGTVSLKNIKDCAAEFAITMRREAIGSGFSQFGMREILKKGFEELGLQKIYWYVSPENVRAIRFYDKNNYHRADKAQLPIDEGEVGEYIWYLETIGNRE